MPSSEDYNCPICLDLLLEPVVGACGHEFCKECYEQWLSNSRTHPSCPLCRIPLSLNVPGISRRLAELIEASFPNKTRKRRAAREQERKAEAVPPSSPALPAASAAPHAPANDRPLSATHSSASLEYLSGGRERPADDAAPDDDDDGREASPPYFPRVFNTSAVRSHDPSLDSTIRVPHESPLASSTSNLLAAFSADPTELPPQQSSSAGVVRLSWPPAGPTPALHRLSPASRAGPVPLLDPVLDFLRRMAPRVPAAHGDFSRLQAVSRLINSSEDVDVLAEHAGQAALPRAASAQASMGHVQHQAPQSRSGYDHYMTEPWHATEISAHVPAAPGPRLVSSALLSSSLDLYERPASAASTFAQAMPAPAAMPFTMGVHRWPPARAPRRRGILRSTAMHPPRFSGIRRRRQSR